MFPAGGVSAGRSGRRRSRLLLQQPRTNINVRNVVNQSKSVACWCSQRNGAPGGQSTRAAHCSFLKLAYARALAKRRRALETIAPFTAALMLTSASALRMPAAPRAAQGTEERPQQLVLGQRRAASRE